MESFELTVEPILDNYCFDCHGLGVSEGQVTLDEFTEESIGDTKLWLRVLKNTRAHIMPPQEEAQPTDEERAVLANWIKAGPFGIDPKNPDPGHMVVQRLNRIEYQNTIRDLIGIEFDAFEAFPPDDSGEGFDNLGEVLSISPMLLEKYLDAAQAIVEKAVPTQSRVLQEIKLSGEGLVNYFSPAAEGDEDPNNFYMSYYESSTRFAQHTVEHPGTYQIVLSIAPKSFSSFRGFDYNRCRFSFQVDGTTLYEKEFEYTYGRTHEYAFDFQWQPGTKEFKFMVEPLTKDLEQVKKLKMEVLGLTIRGPMEEKYWVPPEGYENYFAGGVPERASQKKRRAREILEKFADRAYRRPVDRQTINRLVDLAERVYLQDGFSFEAGIAQAMVAILASPSFLFREEESKRRTWGEKHPYIDEYTLASRISYFLWSTMPDEELFALAEAGKLRDNLDQQIERMIADKRFDNLIENFGGQWLHSRDIISVNISDYDVWLREYEDTKYYWARKEYREVREIPEPARTPKQTDRYWELRDILDEASSIEKPDWSGSLRRALKEETELYFEHIIRGDRSLLEILDSDYTFLNEELARHYGIPGVEGPKMRKVALPPDSPRGGVITQGTILAFTSNPTRTSPVKRGVFLLENILGTPPAPPPPDVPALEEVESEDQDNPLSLRDVLAIHREEPLCSSCHNRMDPLGLALEKFNAMGMYRESELNQPIETGGVLITGETFSSVQEMKRILANERKRDFYYCISEKLLTYALGRGLEYYDTETLDFLVNTLEKNDGRPSALLKAIIKSAPFQKRRHPKYNPD